MDVSQHGPEIDVEYMQMPDIRKMQHPSFVQWCSGVAIYTSTRLKLKFLKTLPSVSCSTTVISGQQGIPLLDGLDR